MDAQRDSQTPLQCANKCGFYGRPETRNLCSKCYRDCVQTEKEVAAIANVLGSELKIGESSAVPCPDLYKSEDGLVVGVGKSKGRDERCGHCNKRVGLLKRFACRCGSVYCSTHRYPEEHACSFDFRAAGRVLLAKANPAVKADKLTRI